MVLLPFSVRDHIGKILSGEKPQTTRIPRKPRRNGAPAYSVGEKVQLYYKPRMGRTCKNCLKGEMGDCDKTIFCLNYNNFFGESEITDIIHYWDSRMYSLGSASNPEQNDWAVADGFDDFEQADIWFTQSTGNKNWMDKDLDVIMWNPEMIARRVA